LTAPALAALPVSPPAPPDSASSSNPPSRFESASAVLPSAKVDSTLEVPGHHGRITTRNGGAEASRTRKPEHSMWPTPAVSCVDAGRLPKQNRPSSCSSEI